MTDVTAQAAHDAMTAQAETSQQEQQPPQERLFVETTTKSFISRDARIEESRQVEVKGRSIVSAGVVLDSRHGWIRIGRYCYLDENTILLPSELDGNSRTPGTSTGSSARATAPSTIATPTSTASPSCVPINIGSHTRIGRDCHVQAAAIGSYCCIGDRVTLGKRVIVKDCCVLEDNVVLGDDTIVPPFTRLASCRDANSGATDDTTKDAEWQWSHPYTLELPPSIAFQRQEDSIQAYRDFVVKYGY